MKTIHDAVSSKIESAGSTVKDIVVDEIVKVEIDRRAGLIGSAFKKSEVLQKELKKIERNDITVYVDGVATEQMSKDRFDKIQKAKEQIGELEKLATNALDTNTDDAYNKLADFLKRIDGGNKEASQG